MGVDIGNRDDLTLPDWYIEVLAQSLCGLEGAMGSGLPEDEPDNPMHDWGTLTSQQQRFYRQAVWDVIVKRMSKPEFVTTTAHRFQSGLSNDPEERAETLQDLGHFYDWMTNLSTVLNGSLHSALRIFDQRGASLKKKRQARRQTGFEAAERIRRENSPFVVGDVWSRGEGKPVAYIQFITEEGDISWVIVSNTRSGEPIAGGGSPTSFIHRFGSRIGPASEEQRRRANGGEDP